LQLLFSESLLVPTIAPLRRIDTLSDDEVGVLWRALREMLQESIDRSGSAWELNLYGEKGGWGKRFLLVGYREGEPCPACGTAVVKIKNYVTFPRVLPALRPTARRRFAPRYPAWG